MQIITGVARGSKIRTLEGSDTRPTSSKAKAGIFSSIQFDIEGKRVLDLFAGCGQMGIEALSRGAKSCVFVDKNKKATRIIEENLQNTLKYTAEFVKISKVLCQDAAMFIDMTPDVFDIVFLDPPYAAGLIEQLMPKVSEKLCTGGLLICESEHDLCLDGFGLELKKKYKYSRATVAIYYKR